MGSLTQWGDRRRAGEVSRGRLIQQRRCQSRAAFLPLPLQNSFSSPPPLLFLFHLSLFHTQYFPQIWGIIPILPPSASESNLISLRSTPVNLLLMLQSSSSTSLISPHLFYSQWNPSVDLKSPTESNLIFLTISHTNVYLKRSNALFSLWWSLSVPLVIHPSLFHQQMEKSRIYDIMCWKIGTLEEGKFPDCYSNINEYDFNLLCN